MEKLARHCVRQTSHGVLATSDKQDQAPYASLVAVATSMRGEPLMLLSDLARHTQNIEKEKRISICFAQQIYGHRNPLEEPRVSIVGQVRKTDESRHRQRFLARHADAETYVDFTDFNLYIMDVFEAHFVAGFGRIVTITGEKMLLSENSISELAEIEQSAIDHMAEDHQDSIELYCRVGAHEDGVELSIKPDNAKILDIDPEGIGLGCKGWQGRINFPEPLHSAQSLRSTLAQMSEQFRQSLEV